MGLGAIVRSTWIQELRKNETDTTERVMAAEGVALKYRKIKISCLLKEALARRRCRVFPSRLDDADRVRSEGEELLLFVKPIVH